MQFHWVSAVPPTIDIQYIFENHSQHVRHAQIRLVALDC